MVVLFTTNFWFCVVLLSGLRPMACRHSRESGNPGCNVLAVREPQLLIFIIAEGDTKKTGFPLSRE
jgi:hypothetical protein